MFGLPAYASPSDTTLTDASAGVNASVAAVVASAAGTFAAYATVGGRSWIAGPISGVQRIGRPAAITTASPLNGTAPIWRDGSCDDAALSTVTKLQCVDLDAGVCRDLLIVEGGVVRVAFNALRDPVILSDDSTTFTTPMCNVATIFGPNDDANVGGIIQAYNRFNVTTLRDATFEQLFFDLSDPSVLYLLARTAFHFHVLVVNVSDASQVVQRSVLAPVAANTVAAMVLAPAEPQGFYLLVMKSGAGGLLRYDFSLGGASAIANLVSLLRVHRRGQSPGRPPGSAPDGLAVRHR